MDKAKAIKMGLKLGALVLTGIATVMSDKVNKTDMDETIAAKVAETLANQAKES